MKKIILPLFILTFLSGIFSGCEPYEEGPFLSLKTRTTRLVGSWRVNTGPFLNGVPSGAEEVLLTFERDRILALPTNMTWTPSR